MVGVRRGELDGAPDGDDVVLKFPVDELGAVVCAVSLGGADVLGVGLPLSACVDGVCGFINETPRPVASSMKPMAKQRP